MVARDTREDPSDVPQHLVRRRPVDDDDRDRSPYHPQDAFQPDRRGVGDDVGDPGFVEPYGAVEAKVDDFHLDEIIYVCTSCGYQTAEAGRPDACPNCAAQDGFFAQEM